MLAIQFHGTFCCGGITPQQSVHDCGMKLTTGLDIAGRRGRRMHGGLQKIEQRFQLSKLNLSDILQAGLVSAMSLSAPILPSSTLPTGREDSHALRITSAFDAALLRISLRSDGGTGFRASARVPSKVVEVSGGEAIDREVIVGQFNAGRLNAGEVGTGAF